MEISRDVMLLIVKAARASQGLSDCMKKIMLGCSGLTLADEIAGYLSEALYESCGEKIENDQDFLNDSQTMKFLTDPALSDGEVTAALVGMYRSNHPEQPKPHFIDREEMRKQAEAGCGYMAPEGGRK